MVRKLHRKCVTRTGLNANFHFIQIPTASKNLQLHYKFYITQPLSGECLWIHKTGINIYARIWKNFFFCVNTSSSKMLTIFFRQMLLFEISLAQSSHSAPLCRATPLFRVYLSPGCEKDNKTIIFLLKICKNEFLNLFPSTIVRIELTTRALRGPKCWRKAFENGKLYGKSIKFYYASNIVE